MPFIDGEPIDAAKLSELETAFNVLKAQVPQFGTGATAVTGSGVGNSGAVTTVVPYKIIARASGTAYSLTAGNSNINQIKFPDGSNFSVTPTIIITSRMSSKTADAYIAKGLDLPTASIVTGTMSNDGFSVMCPVPKSGPGGSYYISYIAIQGA